MLDKAIKYSSKKAIPGISTVLDIGCGEGDSLLYLQEKYNFSCYGVDKGLTPDARTRLSGKGINVTQGSLEKPNFLIELNPMGLAFDIVIIECVLSLLPMDKLNTILPEIKRAVAQNGHLYIADVFDIDMANFNFLVKLIEDCGFDMIYCDEESEAYYSYIAENVFSKGRETFVQEQVCKEDNINNSTQTYYSLLFRKEQ
jgi:SAM-dependent methyltransferase